MAAQEMLLVGYQPQLLKRVEVGSVTKRGGVSNADINGNNAWQIKAIGVVISTFETPPAPDNVLVSGVLTNGAVASVHVATVPWHGTGWRLEVYGREGTLVATSEQMVQYAHIRLRGGRGEDGALQALPVPDRLTWVSAAVPQGPPFNVAQMYHRLGEAIREGREAQPDFDVAVKRHCLLDAMQRASDRGTRVPVS